MTTRCKVVPKDMFLKLCLYWLLFVSQLLLVFGDTAFVEDGGRFLKALHDNTVDRIVLTKNVELVPEQWPKEYRLARNLTILTEPSPAYWRLNFNYIAQKLSLSPGVWLEFYHIVVENIMPRLSQNLDVLTLSRGATVVFNESVKHQATCLPWNLRAEKLNMTVRPLSRPGPQRFEVLQTGWCDTQKRCWNPALRYHEVVLIGPENPEGNEGAYTLWYHDSWATCEVLAHTSCSSTRSWSDCIYESNMRIFNERRVEEEQHKHLIAGVVGGVVGPLVLGCALAALWGRWMQKAKEKDDLPVLDQGPTPMPPWRSPSVLPKKENCAVLESVLCCPEDITLGPLLGTGSYGKVYQGEWHGMTVAVKVLFHGQNTKERVTNEVKLSLSFFNPHVVRSYHCLTITPAGSTLDSTDTVVGDQGHNKASAVVSHHKAAPGSPQPPLHSGRVVPSLSAPGPRLELSDLEGFSTPVSFAMEGNDMAYAGVDEAQHDLGGAAASCPSRGQESKAAGTHSVVPIEEFPRGCAIDDPLVPSVASRGLEFPHSRGPLQDLAKESLKAVYTLEEQLEMMGIRVAPPPAGAPSYPRYPTPSTMGFPTDRSVEVVWNNGMTPEFSSEFELMCYKYYCQNGAPNMPLGSRASQQAIQLENARRLCCGCEVQTARATGCISSDGVVEEFTMQTWIVQEYCDKGPLAKAVYGRRFFGKRGTEVNLQAVLLRARDVAEGMKYLHDKHVCHGDLKLDNVLLATSTTDPFGVIAKVADFGLSKAISSGKSHHSTKTYGTVTHMPPELLLSGRLQPAADVYSFGIMLWEMATANVPYPGLLHGEIVQRVVVEDLRPTFPPHIPSDYVRLAQSCWARDPLLRPKFAAVTASLEGLIARVDELQTGLSRALNSWEEVEL